MINILLENENYLRNNIKTKLFYIDPNSKKSKFDLLSDMPILPLTQSTPKSQMPRPQTPGPTRSQQHHPKIPPNPRLPESVLPESDWSKLSEVYQNARPQFPLNPNMPPSQYPKNSAYLTKNFNKKGKKWNLVFESQIDYLKNTKTFGPDHYFTKRLEKYLICNKNVLSEQERKQREIENKDQVSAESIEDFFIKLDRIEIDLLKGLGGSDSRLEVFDLFEVDKAEIKMRPSSSSGRKIKVNEFGEIVRPDSYIETESESIDSEASTAESISRQSQEMSKEEEEESKEEMEEGESSSEEFLNMAHFAKFDNDQMTDHSPGQNRIDLTHLETTNEEPSSDEVTFIDSVCPEGPSSSTVYKPKKSKKAKNGFKTAGGNPVESDVFNKENFKENNNQFLKRLGIRKDKGKQKVKEVKEFQQFKGQIELFGRPKPIQQLHRLFNRRQPNHLQRKHHQSPKLTFKQISRKRKTHPNRS